MAEDQLMRALNDLDEILEKKGEHLEIVICGAYAIELLGFGRSFHTLDIDSICPLKSPVILDAIKQVGQALGLGPQWLNDQASTVNIPDGAIKRAKPLGRWKSIKASVLDRKDLIKMKASAFSIRREQTNKDWEDLALLKPSKGDIQEAVEFLKLTNSPPDNATQKIKDEFEETLNDLKKLI